MKTKKQIARLKKDIVLYCRWCGREPLSESEVYLDRDSADAPSFNCVDWQKCHNKIALELVAQDMQRKHRWIRLDKMPIGQKYVVYHNMRVVLGI